MDTNDALIRKIAGSLRIKRGEEVSTDELIALLAQISLALLIIFVMANVLFMSKARTEVDVAKGMVGFLQGKLDEISNTPAGQQYQMWEKAMIDLQKQKLLKALEKIESLERAKYGLSTFTLKATGTTRYSMGDVFSGDRIVSERFKSACKSAKEDLPYKERVVKDWCSRILIMEGMSINNTPMQKTITKHPEVLTKENEAWLLQEIGKRVGALRTETRDMQRNAIAMLHAYYQDNTDALKGTDVYKLVRDYISAPPEKKGMLIREIRDRLYEHSKSVLDKQGVPLLSEA